ncbi:hypothetical protein [Endozoicomonas sp.]|uniref:hypothetical protein n=1 Tax=Endozoicomonas sp. TaxID=1892382 RepID=UPI002886FEE0|nr:hypothetical protein [Endozoicomonas sp.]
MARIKTGGRQKGTLNKISSESRSLISDFVNRRIASILEKEEEIAEMDIELQLKLIQPLLPYVMVKATEPEAGQQQIIPKVTFTQHIGPGDPKVIPIY